MAKQVDAFEPRLKARQKVLKNINSNLSEPRTRLEFSAKYLGAANSDNACTLDSLASSIVGPCFIKIDVDGGEADILRGATRILKLAGVRWLIETHSQKLEQECVELLGRTGYKVIIVHQAWWRRFVPELRPGVHNQWLIATQSEDVI